MTDPTPTRSRSRLNYANVVATIALFAALGGGAYAAATAPKNSVTSKSVKDESLTGKDVKANALTGSDISESSLGQVPNAASAAGVVANAVTGAGVQDNSLSGADIDEATLNLPATPSETTPISAEPAGNTGFQTLFEGNGIRIEGDCSGALGDAEYRVDLLEAGILQRTNHFGAQTPTIVSIPGPANDVGTIGIGVNGQATTEFFWRRASDGKTATITLGVTTDNAVAIGKCLYIGVAHAE